MAELDSDFPYPVETSFIIIMKYQILLNILDRIREEAPEKLKSRYLPSTDDFEKINYARSLAFIHLYFKVSFGLLDFEEREWLVTDGSYDGGIDGYYIDKETKKIYLIQSKFRTTERNFESKVIDLSEILQMDIDRILEGDTEDENGNEYRGKIKQLQREVSQIPDVGRYSYVVILLANVDNKTTSSQLRKLTGGYAVEVFNFEKSYDELVFPVITGTYFTASEINIPIDLSGKNAGAKISYTVRTKICDCEITVLFAPAIQMAQIMNKYKNSILKYNPRSYLDLEGKSVNNAIRSTILQSSTNEFALYNNGITLLSDETFINERIGQKNMAQLLVRNPQIINGGQTSYTLSRIYGERSEADAEKVFKDKEVLLKIITLIDNNSHESKLQLIDEISNATNKQTPVINADKFANEIVHQDIQRSIFDRYGLLYERKRGEFSDGILNNYISEENVIERNQFLRLLYVANGQPNKGIQRRLFQRNEFSDLPLNDKNLYDRFYVAIKVFSELTAGNKYKNRTIPLSVYAQVSAYVFAFMEDSVDIELPIPKDDIIRISSKFSEFMENKKSKIGKWHKRKTNKAGNEVYRFKEEQYYGSADFANDMKTLFSKPAIHTE